MSNSTITDKATDHIFVASKNAYYWRIIEIVSTDSAGQQQKKQKIGLSRFWFNERYNRWIPSKSHVFLPVEAFKNIKNSLDRIGFHIDDDTQHDDGHPNELDNVIQPTVAATVSSANNNGAEHGTLVERKRGRPAGVRRTRSKEGRADSGKNTKETQRDAAEANTPGRQAKTPKVCKVVPYDADCEDCGADCDTTCDQ